MTSILDSSREGTFLAERAAEVDPDAEGIQAALVKLYRLSGAHAAAAERYAHYAQAMRDLGVEPVAFRRRARPPVAGIGTHAY